MQTQMRTNWRTASWAYRRASAEYVQTGRKHGGALPPHLLLLFPDTPDVSGELVIAPNAFVERSVVLGASSIQLDPTLIRRPHYTQVVPEVDLSRLFLNTLKKAAEISHDLDPFGFITLEAERLAGGLTGLVITAAGQHVNADRPLILAPSDCRLEALVLLDEMEEADLEPDQVSMADLPDIVDPVDLTRVIDEVRDACNQDIDRPGWLNRLQESCPCSAAHAHSLITTAVQKALLFSTDPAGISRDKVRMIAAEISDDIPNEDGCSMQAACTWNNSLDQARWGVVTAGVQKVAAAKAPPPPGVYEPFEVGW